MQWLSDLPFADNRVLQIGFLAACGIAALVVLALVYRLVFAHRLRVPGGRTRQPRLGLVDAFSLDGQRQLVLVRRDNVEHLVMIGGPNDVLIEPQINRAMAPARENSQPSPLLAPGALGRRSEAAGVVAPVAAEAPPTKVAASLAASSPAAASAAAPAPAVPRAPAAASAAPPPAAPRAPAEGLANATTPPPRPTGPEQGRPASSAPASPPGAQPAELTRPAPASSPPPRPTPTRPAMPPPIAPPSGSGMRAPIARMTEKGPPKSSSGPGHPSWSAQGNSPSTPPPASPGAPPRSEKAASAVAAAKTEPRASPPAASAPAPSAPPQLVARTQQPPAPASNGAQQVSDARPPPQKGPANSSVKPPPKVDDPFADLESLEAEMARLLGREKPG